MRALPRNIQLDCAQVHSGKLQALSDFLTRNMPRGYEAKYTLGGIAAELLLQRPEHETMRIPLGYWLVWLPELATTDDPLLVLPDAVFAALFLIHPDDA